MCTCACTHAYTHATRKSVYTRVRAYTYAYGLAFVYTYAPDALGKAALCLQRGWLAAPVPVHQCMLWSMRAQVHARKYAGEHEFMPVRASARECLHFVFNSVRACVLGVYVCPRGCVHARRYAQLVHVHTRAV